MKRNYATTASIIMVLLYIPALWALCEGIPAWLNLGCALWGLLLALHHSEVHEVLRQIIETLQTED